MPLTKKMAIQDIRDRFINVELEDNPDLYHEVDVDRVRTDEWQIERFLLEYLNEDKAYEAMIKALKWKKEFGIHDRTDQYFPEEYFEFTELEIFGRDRDGRDILWEKTRNYRTFSEFSLLNRQFVAHIIEKMDTMGHRKGFTLITDTNGAGISNVSIDLYKFKIGVLEYYPESMKSNLVVDLPWILNGISKIILAFCGEMLRESVRFINREHLTDYIDDELIPLELNGKRVPHYVIPEQLKPMHQLTHLGLTDKVIDKYINSFK